MNEIAKIIDSYIVTRPPENDTVSETYRGWINEKYYIPLSNQVILESWKKYISSSQKPLIDFYIHIPYCYKLCTYCFYYKELYNKDAIPQYLQYIQDYLAEFEEIFHWVWFKSLYIGWGTPTVLSEVQIEELMRYITSRFSFLPWAEITFEWNPLSFNRQKIELLSKFWVNRISMWVQSLDQNVLKISNREYQNMSMIQKNIAYMHEFWMSSINIDLLMWLKDDTVEKFIYTVTEVIKMRPTCITIYWLWPTEKYVDDFYAGKVGDFFEDLNKKVSDYYDAIMGIKDNFWSDTQFTVDKSNGHVWLVYIWAHGWTTKYSYNDFWEGSLFSVWPTARSHIYGNLTYKLIWETITKYVEDDIVHIGNFIELHDEITLYVIMEIRDRTFIDFEVFYAKFWVHFEDVYREIIPELIERKKIEIKNSKIFFHFEIHEKLYYSLFFTHKKRLIEKSTFLNSENTVSKEILWEIVEFTLFRYENKVEVLMYTNYKLSYKNIKLYLHTYKKILKIVDLAEQKWKDIPFIKQLIEAFFAQK